jgi:RNA polymerase sigma-70 factor (ECF subfamily)
VPVVACFCSARTLSCDHVAGRQHTETFLAHVPEPLRDGAAKLADLGPRLEQLVNTSRLAWPDIEVDESTFIRHVAERLTEAESADAALELVHGEELYLSCACAQALDGAVATFHARYFPAVRAAVAPLGSQDMVEEVLQQLAAKLFTSAPDKPPAINKYAGRGELSAWLRVMATRDAYKLINKHRGRGADIDALADLAIDVDDPELQTLKTTYRAHFKKAFEHAFARLQPRERNILRHEYLDGLNIDRIGVLYGVHRATVARWRAKAREKLFRATRQVFEDELKVTGKEFDSILRLIQSQLHVSLHRLLDEDEPPAGDGDDD